MHTLVQVGRDDGDALAGVINNHIFQTAVVIFEQTCVLTRKKIEHSKKRPSHRPPYRLFMKERRTSEDNLRV